jgi:hypothetical protein
MQSVEQRPKNTRGTEYTLDMILSQFNLNDICVCECECVYVCV